MSSLTVVCLNVAGHWFSPHDPPRLRARLDKIVEKFAEIDPDIVCLQELYSFSVVWPLTWKGERSYFNGVMEKLGYRMVTGNASWSGMDSGLLVLAKTDLVRLDFQFFNAQATLAGVKVPWNSKGYLAAAVRVGDRRVVLFNCHLWWKPQEVAAAQQDQLNEAIEKFRPGKLPGGAGDATHVILCGDFNNLIEPSGLIDGFGPCLVCHEGPTHDDGGTYDHIFVHGKHNCVSSSLLRWSVDDHTPVSDHYGLLVRLALYDD